uniref:hepatocyte growth factor-like protein isoform X2 n=1 Tax=Pristiophorus japonicus TaxID=55135 RepID=UPI00398E606C
MVLTLVQWEPEETTHNDREMLGSEIRINLRTEFWKQILITTVREDFGQRSPLNDYHRSKGVQLQHGSYWPPEEPASEEQCASRCTMNYQCRTFNYNLQSKQCQMLYRTSQVSDAVRNRHNHIDLYEKKGYIRDCIVNNGVTYRGSVAKTRSERTCQQWSSNLPHEHRNSPGQFPEKGLDSNYCRNPDNDQNGPWCYTMDWNTRLETCDIIRCNEEVCVLCNGEDYDGFVDYTESGRECQRWDLNYPHSHKYQPETYPEKKLDDNYCRNPDGSLRPWCYTTDPAVEREYCNIQKCRGWRRITAGILMGQKLLGASQQILESGLPYACSSNAVKMTLNLKNVTMEMGQRTEELSIKLGRESHARDGTPIILTSHEGHAKPKSIEDPDEVEFDSCGKREDRMIQKRSRIIGGSPGNSPWTVSLRNRKGKHFCGGSLVSRNWVISSKQCFSSCYAEFRGYEAWMGTVLKNPRSDDPDKQAIPIRKAVCGPNGSNLIMLELESLVTLNSRVAVICLPPQRYIVPEGTRCEIAGWGETQGTGNDDVLNILTMPVMSNKECNQYYRGRVIETEICAGTVIRGAGVCERDYGGPLACFAHDCWVLEGVIIPGRGCGRPNRPGIFVRVAMFVDWIKKVMEL